MTTLTYDPACVYDAKCMMCGNGFEADIRVFPSTLLATCRDCVMLHRRKKAYMAGCAFLLIAGAIILAGAASYGTYYVLRWIFS